MRRLAEMALVLPVATGLHVAAFGIAGGDFGRAGGAGGDGGADLVTLAAAPPALAALAEAWTAAPEAQTETPDLSPVAPVKRATLPAPDTRPRSSVTPIALAPPAADTDAQPSPVPFRAPALPDRLAALAETAPAASAERGPFPEPPERIASLTAPVATDLDAPPQPDRPEDMARRVEESPRPLARPAAPAEPPRAAQRASGPASGSAAGAGGHQAPTLSAERAGALRAEWGGHILARVNRVHSYPHGTRASGRAMVELVVARDGRLLSARLMQSAGDAVLDRAALAAVHRAGRFPAAPKGLTRASYSFTLPLRFAWRG